MSENQKCLNFIRGGSAIFKNVWNSKKSEISDGGGQANLGIFPKFFRFFFYDGSPKAKNLIPWNIRNHKHQI